MEPDSNQRRTMPPSAIQQIAAISLSAIHPKVTKGNQRFPLVGSPSLPAWLGSRRRESRGRDQPGHPLPRRLHLFGGVELFVDWSRGGDSHPRHLHGTQAFLLLNHRDICHERDALAPFREVLGPRPGVEPGPVVLGEQPEAASRGVDRWAARGRWRGSVRSIRCATAPDHGIGQQSRAC